MLLIITLATMIKCIGVAGNVQVVEIDGQTKFLNKKQLSCSSYKEDNNILPIDNQSEDKIINKAAILAPIFIKDLTPEEINNIIQSPDIMETEKYEKVINDQGYKLGYIRIRK